MNKEADGQKETKQSTCEGSVFTYLAAEVGIGAALSVLFARDPEMGCEQMPRCD